MSRSAEEGPFLEIDEKWRSGKKRHHQHQKKKKSASPGESVYKSLAIFIEQYGSSNNLEYSDEDSNPPDILPQRPSDNKGRLKKKIGLRRRRFRPKRNRE